MQTVLRLIIKKLMQLSKPSKLLLLRRQDLNSSVLPPRVKELTNWGLLQNPGLYQLISRTPPRLCWKVWMCFPVARLVAKQLCKMMVINLGVLPEKYCSWKPVFGLKTEGCSRSLVNCPVICSRRKNKKGLYKVFSFPGSLKRVYPIVCPEKTYLGSKKKGIKN